MTTMNQHTLQLIAQFLSQYNDEFANFLDTQDIEGSETEVIINDLRQAFAHDPKRSVIDRKFAIHAYNPVTHKYYSQHDAILFCAKDEALPATLQAYAVECARLGANPEHIKGIGLMIDRVEEFQVMVERHVPDTVGAEIDRCIYGDGI